MSIYTGILLDNNTVAIANKMFILVMKMSFSHSPLNLLLLARNISGVHAMLY